MAQPTSTSEQEDAAAPHGRSSLRRKLEISWVITVVVFTLVRLLVARETLVQYDLNIWVFGIIDLATAFPYALGTAKIVEGFVDRDNKAIGWWAIVAGASFLAPYGYVALVGTGGEFPGAVWIVLGVLVAVFGANAIWSVVRKVRAARLAALMGEQDADPEVDDHAVAAGEVSEAPRG